ncbi:MAG TPA: MucR family transcriptional regulator [Alphaproteobacteria bacterium]|nr:MucR family transcriptional regulator [Alphaproteobacteria bacterium]
MSDDKDSSPADLLRMTAEVAAAYVSNNTLPAADLTEVIKTIYTSLQSLERSEGVATTSQKPMVPIKKSVTPEYIICLEDGKRLKMLKRHLRTAYRMTPEEYRAKWGLPADYPMVAPNYAEQRSVFAKRIGLGRKPGSKKKK